MEVGRVEHLLNGMCSFIPFSIIFLVIISGYLMLGSLIILFNYEEQKNFNNLLIETVQIAKQKVDAIGPGVTVDELDEIMGEMIMYLSKNYNETKIHHSVLNTLNLAFGIMVDTKAVIYIVVLSIALNILVWMVYWHEDGVITNLEQVAGRFARPIRLRIVPFLEGYSPLLFLAILVNGMLLFCLVIRAMSGEASFQEQSLQFFRYFLGIENIFESESSFYQIVGFLLGIAAQVFYSILIALIAVAIYSDIGALTGWFHLRIVDFFHDLI